MLIGVFVSGLWDRAIIDRFLGEDEINHDKDVKIALTLKRAIKGVNHIMSKLQGIKAVGVYTWKKTTTLENTKDKSRGILF